MRDSSDEESKSSILACGGGARRETNLGWEAGRLVAGFDALSGRLSGPVSQNTAELLSHGEQLEVQLGSEQSHLAQLGRRSQLQFCQESRAATRCHHSHTAANPTQLASNQHHRLNLDRN